LSQVVAGKTFQELSTEVVERFLQTVVVLDDGATMGPPPSVGKLVEPDNDISLMEEDEGESSAGSEAMGRDRNPLDAQALISGFAEHGLVCAVLAPSSDAGASDPTVRTSKRADIVILDWELGDEGEKTREIIRRLIEQDQDAGGRLRMIVVYTQNRDLEDVRVKVSRTLKDNPLTPAERSDKVLVLTAQYTRILFIRKGITSSLVGQVNELDLPRRVITEFVEFGKGILANVAFAGIAAIREETHRVLARFHSRLDAPFLTHRVLLENPRDSEGFSVDLLNSEIAAILQHKGIGSRYTGRDAILSALCEWEGQGKQFQLMTKNDSLENPTKLTIDDLMKLVDSGPSGLEEINNVGVGKRQLHERLFLLFTQNLEKSKESHYEFARAAARAREPATVSSDYQASLDLGSIVLSQDEYFVCIQPSCDALRLSGKTQFIFASLSNSNKASRQPFDVVIRDLRDNDICLKLNCKASMIRTVSFDPDDTTKTVLTSIDNGFRKFTSASGEDFIWICDLRTSFAQRFVHRIASNLSRIGLDEFEWQRRHSSMD